MSLSTGDIIDGKYRIVRLLGEGGMGAVYEGENMRIKRRVAIKVLHSGVAENSDAVQRFEREAQAAGRIGSQHIVEVLDLGDLPDGDRYMVMEFMDGDSLSARVQKRGRLKPAEIYPIAVQLMEGLAAAHGAGIIHRDLKPDNIFVLSQHAGHTDFVKILDFGISKFNSLGGDSGFSMTRTGAVMGTPYYMSPEQAKGAKGMDQRADLYSVGVILYECATGQVPFNADTFNELLFKIVLEEPPPIESIVPDIDRGFAEIIRKSMAREPAHRFQTARELQEALHAWAQTGEGVGALPPEANRPALASMAGASGAYAAQPATSLPGASQQLGGTQGSWSQSQVAPKKSNTGLIVGLAAAAVVLIGGGAAVAVTLGGSDDAVAPAAAQSPEQPEQPAADPKPAPEQPAADEKPEAEQDKQAETDEKPADEKPADEKPEAQPEPVAVKPQPARPAGPQQPPPAKKDPPPPADKTGKSGGRTIRTEL